MFSLIFINFQNGCASYAESKVWHASPQRSLEFHARAAAALNFTQPAVSHQISQLEQQLGVTLSCAQRGKISLTPEGEIVVQYVRRMKALEQQLLDDLQSADRRLTRLRVGITHTAESNLITEALCKIRAGKRWRIDNDYN